MNAPTTRVVVTDANVLINFMHVGRLSLCADLPNLEFVVPDHVRQEIRWKGQRAELDEALAAGALDAASITDQATSEHSRSSSLADKLVEELHRSRCEKLPNETGGVLIGSHDLEHLTIHLVTRVPSPSDSTEWPTLYIRGARDLSRRVRSHERATDGMLGYVGEWHSHPVGRDSSPSRLDRRALDNLAKEMGNDGLPALTLIVGENDLTILGQFDGYSGEARWVSHSGAPNPLVYGPTTGRKA